MAEKSALLTFLFDAISNFLKFLYDAEKKESKKHTIAIFFVAFFIIICIVVLIFLLWDPKRVTQNDFKNASTEQAADEVSVGTPHIKNETVKKSYYYNVAKDALDQGDYEKALQVLNEGIVDFGNFTSLYVLRGETYYEMERYQDSIEDYNRAIGMISDSSGEEAYFGRGKAYCEREEYKKAISDFTKAIELNDKNVDVYNWRSYAYYQNGQCEEAISDSQNAIRLDPQNQYAYFRMGYTYYTVNDYEKAVQNLSKAIELAPEEVDYYIYCGNAVYELERYDDAIMLYEKAIALGCSDINLNLMLGELYNSRKQSEKAISACNNCIIQDDQNGWAYAIRGDAKCYLNDGKGAIEDYTRALVLGNYSDNAYLYACRAWAYYNILDDKKSALADIDEAITLAPDNESYQNIKKSIK